jgi:putative membrane protein
MSDAPALDKSTRLAYDRTWLAYERTMQAWIRTAISLITFGFSVYRLADLVDRNPADRKLLAGPHEFGYILVSIGFVALALATVEYSRSMRMLRAEYGQAPRSTAVWFAGIIAALGIFALVSMILTP